MGPEIVLGARFLLTAIAVLLLFLASVTWSRRKETPEAAVFAVLVGAMSVYAFGYAGEIASVTVESARRWLDVEYLVLPWAGALSLLAACRHNGRKVKAWLLFIIPAIVFVGHYTNFGQLAYSAPMTVLQRGPFWVLELHRGPLALLDNAYLAITFLSGAWVYFSEIRNASSLFRKQALVLVISCFVPIVGYFSYRLGLSPYGLDITPVSLGATCLLLYYGLFHCGIFDLSPMARTLIFNTIRDAVLIVDNHERLLDFNPAARALLPMLNKKSVGMEIGTLLKAIPGLAVALAESQVPVEFVLNFEAVPQTYEIRVWPLFAGVTKSGSLRGSHQGRAVILADVTPQVQLREELRRRSETDPLTGVANRRRFYQALEIECSRYARGHSPLSLLMIDLDFFKEVNDRYGHPAGDAVLRAVSQLLTQSLRKTDMLARYGGEEFSVLLCETRVEGASIIAERIRSMVRKSPLEVDGVQIPVSVSIGVASHSSDKEVAPEILLKKADVALYRAKALGRNRIEVM